MRLFVIQSYDLNHEQRGLSCISHNADNQGNGDASSNLISAHGQAEVPICICNSKCEHPATSSCLSSIAFGSALSGKPSGDMNNSTNENRSQFAPGRLHCPNINKPSWSKPWEKTSSAHRGITNLPENANVTQNKHVYPPSNMQNTIASLTGAIDSFPQQHLNMHTRQEIITSTLEYVLSALQQLRATITLPL